MITMTTDEGWLNSLYRYDFDLQKAKNSTPKNSRCCYTGVSLLDDASDGDGAVVGVNVALATTATTALARLFSFFMQTGARGRILILTFSLLPATQAVSYLLK